MPEPERETKATWWGTTRSVLLHPQQFFKELPIDVPFRTSVAYLVKTSFVTALVHAIILAVAMFVILTAFFSIFAFFVGMFGFIFSPFLAAVTGLPPEKVIQNALAFEKNGNSQLLSVSMQAGLFVLMVGFIGVTGGAFLLSGIAHAFIKLFGGTSSYRATFRTYCYSSAVVLLSLIPVVHVIVLPYGVILNYFGTRSVSGLSKSLSCLVVVAAVGLPMAFGIWFESLDPEIGTRPHKVETTPPINGTIDSTKPR